MEPNTKLPKYGDWIDISKYHNLIGSQYLTNTRVDFMLRVEIHVETNFEVYMRGTISFRLFYSKTNYYSLCGNSDSD